MAVVSNEVAEVAEAGLPSRQGRLNRDLFITVGFFIAFVLLWEAIVKLFGINSLLVPAPSSIASALGGGFGSGLFLPHLGYTLSETLLGFGIGSVVGVIVGGFIAQYPILEKTVYPLVVAVQSLPKVAVAPLLVLWLGYGIESKVATGALLAFFPVVVNVMIGLRATDRSQLELFDSLRATAWQKFTMVQLPNSLPYLFAGLEVGIVFSMLGALVGEFVGGRFGLGVIILQANFRLDVATVFAVFVILSVIGTALHAIVRFFHMRFAFWVETEMKGV